MNAFRSQRAILRSKQTVWLFCLLLSGVGFSFKAYGQANTSVLWGVDGANWNKDTSRLKNFTNVGYRSGSVPIPSATERPNLIDVTQPPYNAIPDDGIDDSAAFIHALADCAPNHAVYVPQGRYIITQRIVMNKNGVILRGEDMYATVLFFPKALEEVEIDQTGFDLSQDWKPQKTPGPSSGFIRVNGGVEKGIENLTLEFREERKMDHHCMKGSSAVAFAGDVSDSWIRNVRILNANEGITFSGGVRVSVLNILFDNFIGRPSIEGTSGKVRFVGHIGIGMSKARYCLFHNIEFRGDYYHEFDIIGVPSHSVVSNITGDNVDLHHHGGGANNNLYTNVSTGKGMGTNALDSTRGMHSETHWGIYGDGLLAPNFNPIEILNNHVFVGYGADFGSSITDNEALWIEAIDPAQLEPKNIYLAQLRHPSINKPLPEGPRPPEPPFSGKVVRVNPTDDMDRDRPTSAGSSVLSLSSTNLFKFDVSAYSIETVSRARLRLSIRNKRIDKLPVTVAAWSVLGDEWSEATPSTANLPALVAELDARHITYEAIESYYEFDVTAFVQEQVAAGDSIISLATKRKSGKGELSNFYSRTAGQAPELIIEMANDPVPGSPTPPKGMRTESLIGNILLNWDDNPEPDVVSYNVYRIRNASDAYGFPIAQGLLTSDFVDTASEAYWQIGRMRPDKVYRYLITAVDENGNESDFSTQFVGTARGPEDDNLPPVFQFESTSLGTIPRSEPFAGSLGGSVVEPEGEELFFVKVSGPDWLTIAYDGSLSGTPEVVDEGLNEFEVQVSAFGGQDFATIQIRVGDENLDMDGDGIEDNWEALYFPGTDIDGSADSDGDGVKDFFEYLYGSNPTGAETQSFKLEIENNIEGRGLVFKWQVQERFELNQHYAAFISSDLGEWRRLLDSEYSLTTTTSNGRRQVELELLQDHGNALFLRLKKHP